MQGRACVNVCVVCKESTGESEFGSDVIVAMGLGVAKQHRLPDSAASPRLTLRLALSASRSGEEYSVRHVYSRTLSSFAPLVPSGLV